jgi:hypothetical protein
MLSSTPHECMGVLDAFILCVSFENGVFLGCGFAMCMGTCLDADRHL